MTHRLVKCPKPDLFKVFRESEIAACNAAAVAGTLIATIAITSMSLPSVGQVHWIVRGLWLLSLATGLISALCACNLQATISRNLSWDQLLGWLNDEREKTGWKDVRGPTGKDSKRGGVFYVPVSSAVLLISAPRALIHYALTAYLIGLGIYLGIIWRDQLNTEVVMGENRNVFICFLISALVFYPLYWLSGLSNKCKNRAYKAEWENLTRAAKVGKLVETRLDRQSCSEGEA
ncbi:uncharacterized protein BKA55DRAFT_587528 [Fusarium redolens]|uniref:Uncharacterized protein n=1 Tax=Fusarium redolens TaxID=48865 RepID=A0A9P9FVX9_FUSRE|nr:uncharacterized protein BKA55DRAFT_587528 [Fusarium redolens]KAH7203078.1 hypothetical protein BKA55DRAFT_587528 [Fusarium redolens]